MWGNVGSPEKFTEYKSLINRDGSFESESHLSPWKLRHVISLDNTFSQSSMISPSHHPLLPPGLTNDFSCDSELLIKSVEHSEFPASSSAIEIDAFAGD